MRETLPLIEYYNQSIHGEKNNEYTIGYNIRRRFRCDIRNCIILYQQEKQVPPVSKRTGNFRVIPALLIPGSERDHRKNPGNPENPDILFPVKKEKDQKIKPSGMPFRHFRISFSAGRIRRPFFPVSVFSVCDRPVSVPTRRDHRFCFQFLLIIFLSFVFQSFLFFSPLIFIRFCLLFFQTSSL